MTAPQQSFDRYSSKEAALAAAAGDMPEGFRVIAWPEEVFSYTQGPWRRAQWRLVFVPSTPAAWRTLRERSTTERKAPAVMPGTA